MDKKVTNVGSLREGNYVILDNEACVVKSIQLSKTGKHGSMKCRLEAMTLVDSKKKVMIFPSSDKIEVPIIEKKEAQVLSVHDDKANVMDLDTYETFDLDIAEDLKDQITEGKQVTYWTILDKRVIKQVK
ncbi:MAG: translation initiation factor IF-5A [Nanoarchaeota archaeon]